MTVFRLLVLAACAIPLVNSARADGLFPEGGSDTIPRLIDVDGRDAVQLPSNPQRSSAARVRLGDSVAANRSRRLSSKRLSAKAPRRDHSATSTVSSGDAIQLASWAREHIEMGSSPNNQFTARDVREIENWARTFDQEYSVIKRAQNTVPAVPPAPEPSADTSSGPNYEFRNGDLSCVDGNCGNDYFGGACNTCSQAGIVGGVEGLFLVPIGEPDQTVTLTNLLTGASRTGSADPGLGAGARVWLGIEHDGSGIRVRYTHFGNDNIDNDPHVPQNEVFGFHEAFELNMRLVDLEVTKQFCLGSYFMDASFGGRYGLLQRNATVLGFGTLGNGVDVTGLAIGANEFEGTGLTASLGGRKAIFNGCGWNCFWNIRGSHLWGDSSASALTEANAVVAPPIGVGSAHSRDTAFANIDNEDIFIGEVQLGIEYERCLRCMPATLFFRAAVEYQHWELDGPMAQSTSFAFLQGGPPAFGARVDAAANASDGELDLIGFILGLGIRY